MKKDLSQLNYLNIKKLNLTASGLMVEINHQMFSEISLGGGGEKNKDKSKLKTVGLCSDTVKLIASVIGSSLLHTEDAAQCTLEMGMLDIARG